MARTWKGDQCSAARRHGIDYCGRAEHKKELLNYGRYGSYIAPEQLEPLLQDAARHHKFDSFEWYCRVTMWEFASRFPDVHSITDLTDEQFLDGLRYVND